MTVLKEDKQAEKGEAITGQRCAVRMHNGKGCGRPIHAGPSDADEEPVCLMHSKDPNKSDAAFQDEIEHILWRAGEGDADFSHFVFPSADYTGREFRAKCTFGFATFTQKATFSAATFMQHANFHKAMFTREVYFSWAEFAQSAFFSEAMFTQCVMFIRTEFTQGAVFSEATFMQDGSFDDAEFTGNAFFSKAAFRQDAAFRGATFTREAYFEETVFEKSAEFFGAMFERRVEFRGTGFREDTEIQPGPMFSLGRFERPELVLFYKTYLGQALFHNCDVSRFQFSSVRWRGRHGNDKRMVFDEIIDAKDSAAGALRTKSESPDDRNYDLIAELYQQLKKNYDDKRDYWTAGDFHYGEMEMKRKATPKPNRASRWLADRIKKSFAANRPSFPARWAKDKGYSERSFHIFRREWHQRSGLAAWYKRASEYGESYGRPLLWLAGALIFFTVLYPLLGLHPALRAGGGQAAGHGSLSRDAAVPELSYRNYFHYGSLQPVSEKLGFHALLGHSLMTSVGVAVLQRDLAYEPSYPWARAFSWLEHTLTSTLIALFLLAVRRQFRR